MSDDRATVYREGTQTIYRASGIGKCLRALVAIGTGYEEHYIESVGDMLERTAGEGILHEPHIVEALIDDGYEVQETQAVVEIPVIPGDHGAIIRGHIDGRVGDRLLEIKTMSKSRFKIWTTNGLDAFPAYQWQLSAYLKGMGLQKALYVVKCRDDGAMSIVEIDAAPVDYKAIRSKVIKAEKYRREGTLPPCPDDVPSNDRWFCPVRYLHDDVDELGEDTAPEKLSKDELKRLEDLGREHARLGEIIKAGRDADSERRGVSKELLATMITPKESRQFGDLTIRRVDSTRVSTLWALIASDLNMSIDEAKSKYQGKTPSIYVTTKVKKKEKRGG